MVGSKSVALCFGFWIFRHTTKNPVAYATSWSLTLSPDYLSWPTEMIASTASVHAFAANMSITTLFPVFFYKVGWVNAHSKCTSATMTICCFDFDSYMYTPEWMTNLHIAAHQDNWQIPFGYPQVKNIFSLLQLGKSFCHFAISSFKHAQCKTTQPIQWCF